MRWAHLNQQCAHLPSWGTGPNILLLTKLWVNWQHMASGWCIIWWFSEHMTQSRTSFFLYVCVISSLSATAGMTSSLSASLSVRALSPLLTSMSSLTPRDWGRTTCSDWPTNYATSTITGQWVQQVFRTFYPVNNVICSEHFQLHTVHLEHLVWISIVSLQTCCES